jgi:hypothetical protein
MSNHFFLFFRRLKINHINVEIEGFILERGTVMTNYKLVFVPSEIFELLCFRMLLLRRSTVLTGPAPWSRD